MNSASRMTNGLARYFLVTLGWVCICLAILGIFLPLLPTTVFLLIAAWCFARSSERFHQWLLNHPKLGPIIHNWQSNAGIARNVRNRAIIVLWISMMISMLIVAKWWVALILVCIGCGVSIYLLRLPVLKNSTSTSTCPLRQTVHSNSPQ